MNLKKKFYESKSYNKFSIASTMILTHVSWMNRHYIGKPAELWRERFEAFGIHLYVPLHTIICHCAHGIINHDSENLIVVIPLL